MTHSDWYGYRVIAWVVVAVLALAAAVAVFQGGMWDGLIPAGMALALVVAILAIRLPAVFEAILALALLMSALGWTWGLYRPVPGYDEVAHCLTTLALTLVGCFLFYRPLLGYFGNHTFRLAVAVITLGVAIGALWEMAEYAGMVLFSHTDGEVLKDEISDLAVDTVGAILAVPMVLWALRDQPERWGVARAAGERHPRA